MAHESDRGNGMTDQYAPASVPPPSLWVFRHAPLIPEGEVLDLACGRGRHAAHLAMLGHPVLAVDRDPDALAATAALRDVLDGGLLNIHTLCCDLETPDFPWPLGIARFLGIVVTHYLHRPLLDDLVASLKPDGVLIYETFSSGNEKFGKPTNPNFLLQPGELLDLAARHGLQILAYEDAVAGGAQPAKLQRLCAGGPGFGKEARVLASI
jgi:SAM-dependent methyltransferase